MKTIATLALFLLMTAPSLACPQQTAEAALDDESTAEDTSSSSSAPADSNAGQDQSSEDGANSDADVMKKFTRHRPGACPEGPPCKVED